MTGLGIRGYSGSMDVRIDFDAPLRYMALEIPVPPGHEGPPYRIDLREPLAIPAEEIDGLMRAYFVFSPDAWREIKARFPTAVDPGGTL